MNNNNEDITVVNNQNEVLPEKKAYAQVAGKVTPDVKEFIEKLYKGAGNETETFNSALEKLIIAYKNQPMVAEGLNIAEDIKKIQEVILSVSKIADAIGGKAQIFAAKNVEEVNAKLDAKNDIFSEVMNDFKKQTESILEVNSKLKEENSALIATVAELKANKKEVDGALASLTEQSGKLAKEYASLLEDKSLLNSKLEEASIHAKTLEGDIQSLQPYKKEAEELSIDNTRLTRELTDVNFKLQNALDKIETNKDDVKRVKDYASDLEKQINQLRGELSKTYSEYAIVKANLEQATGNIAELRQSKESLTIELKEAKTTVQSLEKEMSDMIINHKSAIIDVRESVKVELEAKYAVEIKALKEELLKLQVKQEFKDASK